MLFVLLYGPEPVQLQPLATGAVLLALVFALNLNAEQFLAAETRSGALEQWLFYSLSPYFLLLAKLLAFCLVSCLPLLLALPVFALLLAVELEIALVNMAWTLALVGPTLSGIAALAAGLCLSLQNRAFLVQLIALPLSVPLIILATQALADSAGLAFYLPLLAAALLLVLALVPLLLLAILRAGLQ